MDEYIAVARARKLLKDAGVTTVPVDSEALASFLGFQVLRTELAKGESGCTVKRREKICIWVNQDDSPLRQRFTILHEIAHHILELESNHGDKVPSDELERYSYDERGNLIGQLRSVALSSGDHYDSLGYAYDGANQLARIDYPQGFSILYPRNAAGQVSQVQLQVGSAQPSGFASSLSYLPFGPLKSLTWANGVSLSRSYDQDYRLTEQTVGSWNSTYGYDANSNITTLNSSLLGDLNYSYDALDRLTAEQKASLQQTYSYDAVGNRTGKTTTPIVSGEAQTSTQQTYQYASNSNRLTQLDAQAVTTDAVGNLTQDRANRELVYDAQNRLTSVKLDGNTVAEFRYNALGQRTHKISAQGTTTFLYGPDGQLLGEQQFNDQGSKLSGQYYIWLDSMPLGGVSITFDAHGAIASSEPFYLHSDHLNTPRMATNQTQQNVWQWQSDAFGVGQASGSLAMNLRFPGQYFDQESGLHYNYFRDYDPETGRYVESDPIGLAGGLNTFGYVSSNPMNLIDPKGLAEASVSPFGYGGTVAFGWGPGLSFGADVSICATISPSGVKVSLQATTFDNIYGAFAGYGSQYGAAYGDNISKGFDVSNSDSKYLGGQAAYRVGAGLSANQNNSGVSASGGGGRSVQNGVGAYAGSGTSKSVDFSYGW